MEDADVLVVFTERGLGFAAILGPADIVAAVARPLDAVVLTERVLKVFASVATDAPPNTDDVSWLVDIEGSYKC